MNVVCEGPDGAGKSTLAEALSRATGIRVQQGSGPPRGSGEIERRLVTYLAMDDVVFDRHPAVSQTMYGAMRDEPASIEFRTLVDQFYQTQPLLIYCRATNLDRHCVKPGEDPDHILKLTQRFTFLLGLYDRWALARAHLLYRVGDDPVDVVDVVSRARARHRRVDQ